MATEQRGKSKTKINKSLANHGYFALDEARNIYDSQRGDPLPSMYTGISPERQEALDQILATARGGSTMNMLQPEIDEYQKTLSGGYLEANPYIDEIVRRSTSQAGAAPVSQFASAGRFGGGAMSNAMADAMASTSASLYGDNYQRERERMLSMLGRGNEYAQAAYADPLRIAGVGQQMEADQQAQQAEEFRQYGADTARLQEFLANLNANPLRGESTTKSKTMSLDYGQMATGGLEMLASMAGG